MRVFCVAAAACFYIVLFKTEFISDTGIYLWDWNPQYTYNVYGMEVSFLGFAKESFPEKPDTYSKERVSEIISASESENEGSTDSSLVVPDNIICVMNESFSDLTIYPNVKTDTDCLTYLDSLTENTQQGKLINVNKLPIH
jgi:hypothetical protein